MDIVQYVIYVHNLIDLMLCKDNKSWIDSKIKRQNQSYKIGVIGGEMVGWRVKSMEGKYCMSMKTTGKLWRSFLSFQKEKE
jgi:hypothetical protein